MKPDAPPARAARSWPVNVSWSTPAESSAQGTPTASVTARQACLAARILELQVAGAALLEQDGALPDQLRTAPPVLLLRLVHQPEHQPLDDGQQVVRRAVADHLADDPGVAAVAVLAIGPQADEELGRRPAHPAHTGCAEVGQQAGRMQIAVRLVAAHLDRYQDAGLTGDEAAVDDVGQCDLGIEQDGARRRRQRLHQRALELTQLGRPGTAAALEHRPQADALVGGQHGQRAVLGRELLDGSGLGRREHS